MLDPPYLQRFRLGFRRSVDSRRQNGAVRSAWRVPDSQVPVRLVDEDQHRSLREGPRVCRLPAGGRRIRTLGPTSEDSIFSRPPRIRRRQTGPVASAGFDDRQVQVYPSPSQAGLGNDIHAGSPASRRRQRGAVPAWPLFGLTTGRLLRSNRCSIAVRRRALRKRPSPWESSYDAFAVVAVRMSAFRLSAAIRPSMPWLFRMAANSEWRVATSLIAPSR